LIELGEWQPEHYALDLATGGGHTALAVAPHVAVVTATDLTPTMLDEARTFVREQGVTNAHFQLADAEQLPFGDASFDRVTCRIAPHHFSNVSQAVREAARALKAGGLFLLIDSIAPADPELDHFINKVEKWRDPSHGRSYSREEWLTFFEEAGLQIEHGEIFRRTHNYDDWTARAELSISEKTALEDFILTSTENIRQYFAVTTREDGHLESFSGDFILLKGRKVL
jgi:ubiquinone/menaquinone biosynthesis C-methylase UbiE